MSNAGVTSNGRQYPLFTEDDLYEMQGKKVAVAFNWHLKLFSIREKPGGKVIGYTKAITLEWVSFDIDKKKALAIRKGGPKTLHSYVVGEIGAGDMDATLGRWKWTLKYNPKVAPHFYTPSAGSSISDTKCTGAIAVNLWLEDGKARMAAYLPER
jgi:hypothetical protein